MVTKRSGVTSTPKFYRSSPTRVQNPSMRVSESVNAISSTKVQRPLYWHLLQQVPFMIHHSIKPLDQNLVSSALSYNQSK